MQSLDGVVTLVQEGRFLMQSDAGPYHVFILSHAAAAEPDQLPALQRDQARVRVRFKRGRDTIAMVAHRIERLPGRAAHD
jgi:hypothetical protein